MRLEVAARGVAVTWTPAVVVVAVLAVQKRLAETIVVLLLTRLLLMRLLLMRLLLTRLLLMRLLMQMIILLLLQHQTALAGTPVCRTTFYTRPLTLVSPLDR